MSHLLVADLGGTKSRLALVDLGSRDKEPAVQKTYMNSSYPDFTAVLAEYLAACRESVEYGCLAVAGVVQENTAQLTNLDWIVDGTYLADKFGWSEVFLINDMTALAMAIPQLKSNEVVQLKGGVAHPQEPIAVIAPGTGLGQGYLVPIDGGWIYQASEGGHSGFSPETVDELGIARWLLEKMDFLCVEHVSAGPGIFRLYQYFMEEGSPPPNEHIAQKIHNSKDAVPLIVEAATTPVQCPLCRKVIETYVGALGAEAANQALKINARGGVYIGGGVIAHLIGNDYLSILRERFVKSGKMAQYLKAIPVFMISRAEVLLDGASQYGTFMIDRAKR